MESEIGGIKKRGRNQENEMDWWRASAEDCDRDGLDWRRLQRMGDERGLEWLLQRR